MLGLCGGLKLAAAAKEAFRLNFGIKFGNFLVKPNSNDFLNAPLLTTPIVHLALELLLLFSESIFNFCSFDKIECAPSIALNGLTPFYARSSRLRRTALASLSVLDAVADIGTSL